MPRLPRTLRQLAYRIEFCTRRLAQIATRLSPSLFAQEQEVLSDLHRQYFERRQRLTSLGLTVAE